ncbi:MAG TPA: hypothetical protein DDW18_01630 [Firmicutes bacterium]|nr:hypothetical protein [Bacillota bacterium]
MPRWAFDERKIKNEKHPFESVLSFNGSRNPILWGNPFPRFLTKAKARAHIGASVKKVGKRKDYNTLNSEDK